METLTKPQVISGAFAYEGEKNTIPDAPTGSYLASVQEGFPPITMKPKSQGGLPPEGRDFNGVFNLMSQFYFYKQNGGMYTFDEDVSNAIGGYPLNAMLWYFPTSGTAKWLRSNKANNTDNFITNPEVIGTSWIEENTAASLGNVGDIKESTRLGDAPMGGVWADGSEYTFAEYPQVGEMLQEGLLRQKTYADWQTELTTYGETEYFAYDSGTQKFKVPNMPYSGLDGSVDDTTLDVYSRPSRKYVVLYTGYQEISLKDYTDEIEAVVNEGISNINSASTTATNSFNSNATTKTNAFNTNASDKTDDFNSNYTTQLNAFNNNATSKTTAFNENATSQTNAFNTNAEQKQAAVDSAAAEAEASANNAADSENSAQIWAEGTDEQVQELGGTHSAKGWAAQFDIGPATETSAGTTRYATVAEANAATINNAAVTPAGLANLYSQISSLNTDISGLQTSVNNKQATITGGASTITTNNLTANRALLSDGNGKVAVSSVTNTELGYLDGVTSSIQTQLNGKQSTITGGATTITGSNLTANRALVSDGSGKVSVAAVTSAELGYLDGVTSGIQAQLNNKAPLAVSVNSLSATSGTVSLTTNTVYKMTISGATTFSLPASLTATIDNQIKMFVKVTGTPTITWGTTQFFNGAIPSIAAGNYEFYFDYDPNLSAWVAGALPIGSAS